MVYMSSDVQPKNIYIYNGFKKYQNESENILVEGFKLPKNPVIKATIMVSDGDPGIQHATDGEDILPPESLSLRGDITLPWTDSTLLHNRCNKKKDSVMEPDTSGDLTEVPFDYVEVFNQISSVYGWSDIEPECMGGDPENINFEKMEHSIDVDTFRISKYSHDGNFGPHLASGDKDLEIRISANQDSVITNFLVVGIDSQIPGYPKAEKMICSCSEKENMVCSDRPFYYMIKLQNWGPDAEKGIKIKDEISKNPFFKYVPGTTAVSYTINGGANMSGRWQTIPDINDLSPIDSDNGWEVPGVMEPCNESIRETCDFVHVRFKVTKPDGITEWSREMVLENQAMILDSKGHVILTNEGKVLRTGIDTNCQSKASCADAEYWQCGIDWSYPDCNAISGMCKTCEICDSESGQCIKDPNPRNPECNLTHNAMITIERGKNSPYNGKTPIVIPPVIDGLVLGQFTLHAKEPEPTGEYFKFNTVKIYFENNEFNPEDVNNFRLIYDSNENGLWDSGELIVAVTENLTNEALEFTLVKNRYPAKTTVAFIVVADVSANIPSGTISSFQTKIPYFSSSWVNDDGTPTVYMATQIKFPEFVIEPEVGFVFTKGKNDPVVPNAKTINNNIEVMQFRTKAIDSPNKITAITITAMPYYNIFGEGIEEASLWLDSNGNGIVDSGEKQLSTTAVFETESMEHTFEGINLSYTEGEEQFIILKSKFHLEPGEKAIISVEQNDAVVRENNVTISQLPVVSKIFEAYEKDCIPNPECPDMCGEEECAEYNDGENLADCSLDTVDDNKSSGNGCGCSIL